LTNSPTSFGTFAPTAVGTIVDFVVSNPDLTTLTQAVVRAELVDALSSEGPLTLFAPNNEAFADVPTDIFNQLFFDNDFIPQLVDLLLYHVVGGLFLAADLQVTPTLFPLNGEALFVDFLPLTVDGNNVVDGDNIVSNGVVHIIDGVLSPSWVFNSLEDRIFFADDLSTLFSLLVVAGIDLSGPSALTVVGPTNDAFDLLDPAFVELLLTPAGLDDLQRILTYHVFFGILTSTILMDGFVATLEGGFVEVFTNPLMFNQANAVEVDILANNGVLHKIDQVLNPDDSPVV
jgi:transforming growth factor-beta-induced protein